MAEIKTAAMGMASRNIALMDASKLEARGTYCFAPLCAVDGIVIDKDEEGILADALDALPEASKRPRLMVATG